MKMKNPMLVVTDIFDKFADKLKKCVVELRVEEKEIILEMPKGKVPLKCFIYSKKL